MRLIDRKTGTVDNCAVKSLKRLPLCIFQWGIDEQARNDHLNGSKQATLQEKDRDIQLLDVRTGTVDNCALNEEGSGHPGTSILLKTETNIVDH